MTALRGPAGNVFQGLLQSTLLHFDLLAYSTELWARVNVFCSHQLRPTCFTYAMLAWTSFYHVAPFPVTASVPHLCEITHGVWHKLELVQERLRRRSTVPDLDDKIRQAIGPTSLSLTTSASTLVLGAYTIVPTVSLRPPGKRPSSLSMDNQATEQVVTSPIRYEQPKR